MQSIFHRGTASALIVVAGIALSKISAAESDWTLAKSAEGIKVYTREVANSPLREFKGEEFIAATPGEIVKVLKHPNAFKVWMPGVVASELVKSSESDQYHYLQNAVPWPLDKRDGVYHFTYQFSEEAGIPVVTVLIDAVPEYLPKREGLVRIPKSHGFWRIVGTGSGSNVTYQVHADPGGSIPSWLINSTVVDTPFNTLKGLKAYLELHQEH